MKKRQKKLLTREEALRDTSSMSAPFAFKIEGDCEETTLIYNKNKDVEIIKHEKKDTK